MIVMSGVFVMYVTHLTSSYYYLTFNLSIYTALSVYSCVVTCIFSAALNHVHQSVMKAI